uniref:RING-type domain-containing protein n=1 Tax=Aegilops tauschii subsp. strangulata TaxID=200361 RepID=A0A453B351_AEGTS
DSYEYASKNPELLKNLASLVADAEDFDCPICLSSPSNTVITSCTHIYCQTCILKIHKKTSLLLRRYNILMTMTRAVLTLTNLSLRRCKPCWSY